MTSSSSNNNSSKLESLLGPRLLTKVESAEADKKPNLVNFKESFSHHGPIINTTEALADKDFVVFYFSAAWCPPCRRFSPKLKEFYKTTRDNLSTSKLEIVYVSSDRDVQEFRDNYGTMPWLALESQHHKQLLSRKCHIQGIPTCVVLTGKEGNFVTDQARSDIEAAGGNLEKIKHVLDLWNVKAEQAIPLEEATFSSGPGCFIL